MPWPWRWCLGIAVELWGGSRCQVGGPAGLKVGVDLLVQAQLVILLMRPSKVLALASLRVVERG